jgi:hypothetical protein
LLGQSVIVWDLETVPDLAGFAAANNLVGKSDVEVREAIGDKFPKHHRAQALQPKPFSKLIVDLRIGSCTSPRSNRRGRIEWREFAFAMALPAARINFRGTVAVGPRNNFARCNQAVL